MITLDLIW